MNPNNQIAKVNYCSLLNTFPQWIVFLQDKAKIYAYVVCKYKKSLMVDLQLLRTKVYSRTSLHMVGATEIWIDQSGFRGWKNCTVLTSMYVNRHLGIAFGQLFSLEKALCIFKIPRKWCQMVESEKNMKHKRCKKWTPESLIVCWVLPGRKIFISFWTKYVVPRQIKTRFLKLSITRGQT